MNARRHFGPVAEAAVDLIFPRNCVVTGEPVEGGPFRYLGPGAMRNLHLIEPPLCPACGAPHPGYLAGLERLCAECVQRRPVFSQARALFRYLGSGRALVHALKYTRGAWLVPDLRVFLADQPDFLDFARGCVLVPVPLHKRRERERGFNQSLLVARAVAAEAGGSTEVAPLLRRIRNTPTQTRLDRASRLKNVAGAFALAKGVRPLPERPHIVVDDVLTTGATLSACAAVLLASGVREVRALALAHG